MLNILSGVLSETSDNLYDVTNHKFATPPKNPIMIIK